MLKGYFLTSLRLIRRAHLRPLLEAETGSSGLYTTLHKHPKRQAGKPPLPGREVIHKPWADHQKWLSGPAAWLPGPFVSVSDGAGDSVRAEMPVFADSLKWRRVPSAALKAALAANRVPRTGAVPVVCVVWRGCAQKGRAVPLKLSKRSQQPLRGSQVPSSVFKRPNPYLQQALNSGELPLRPRQQR